MHGEPAPASAFDLPPEDWLRLRELLDQSMTLPAARREAWLLALDAASAPLVPRLRALLAQAGASEPAGPLDTLPKIETGEFAGSRPPDAGEQAGAMVGPYRLVRLLGEGGMASVWLAERTDLLQGRQVALKLPHGAWRRAGLAQRLAREREILARLEHPRISRLYDAGVADGGQPYLALEYLQGTPINSYCTSLGLAVRERVALFVQVCEAVAHAHAQLVVHRDLKPSNVLVNQAGEVSLLDFGIAKLMQGDTAEATELTRELGHAFTPDYAAPEQLRGQPLGTAADIYALGVVLFELLTGTRPYTRANVVKVALAETDEQAAVPRPSDRAAADAGLRTALRGDLDTIVTQAMQPLPAQRYATINALGDDLRRYLAHEPVSAQRDGSGYRLRKFMRRHRLGVSAGLAVALALAGAAGDARGAHAARAAWGLALAQAGAPGLAMAPLQAVVDSTDKAAAVERALAQRNLGIARRLQGQPAEAVAPLQSALSALTERRLRGERLVALTQLGLAHIERGAPAEATALLDEAGTIADELLSAETPAAADLWLARGRLLLARADPAAALPHLARAQAYWQRADPRSRWASEAALALAQGRREAGSARRVAATSTSRSSP